MPELAELSVETIQRMAAELIGQPLSEKDAASVASLLKSLGADMQAFRAMEVAENEPSVVYNPAETES